MLFIKSYCAPTYTHPRDITPKLLLTLISKKYGEKKKLNLDY